MKSYHNKNGSHFIARAAHRWRTVFGLLAPLMLMAPAAHARAAPDGWEVRAENHGAIFAPVETHPGEKLEVWVPDEWYEVRQDARAVR